MDARRGFGRLFDRIVAAAKRWAARGHPTSSESPVPLLKPVPPLARAEPIPADPAEHAVQFAQDWYDRLEFHARRRMRELGIPESRIGASDIDYEFRHAAFHPKERTGGSNSPGARINLNSGLLNPELLAPEVGPKVTVLWKFPPSGQNGCGYRTRAPREPGPVASRNRRPGAGHAAADQRGSPAPPASDSRA